MCQPTAHNSTMSPNSTAPADSYDYNEDGYVGGSGIHYLYRVWALDFNFIKVFNRGERGLLYVPIGNIGVDLRMGGKSSYKNHHLQLFS